MKRGRTQPAPQLRPSEPGAPRFPRPSPAPCSATGPRAGPRRSFLPGWAGRAEGGPPHLPCQQSARFSTGEGLAAACFSSSSPSLSSSPSPPPPLPARTSPAPHPCQLSLPSLPAFPSGSQLSSSEQGQRAGAGRTVTRASCRPLSAARRVAPSAREQSGAGHPVPPRQVGAQPPGGGHPQDPPGTENKREEEKAWAGHAVGGPEGWFVASQQCP